MVSSGLVLVDSSPAGATYADACLAVSGLEATLACLRHLSSWLVFNVLRRVGAAQAVAVTGGGKKAFVRQDTLITAGDIGSGERVSWNYLALVCERSGHKELSWHQKSLKKISSWHLSDW